jgi:hypothetical protein
MQSLYCVMLAYPDEHNVYYIHNQTADQQKRIDVLKLENRLGVAPSFEGVVSSGS